MKLVTFLVPDDLAEEIEHAARVERSDSTTVITRWLIGLSAIHRECRLTGTHISWASRRA